MKTTRALFFLIPLAALVLAASSGRAEAAGAKLDQRPVTAQELSRFQNPKDRAGKTPTKSGDPAVLIDWYQAKAFCAAQGKRLPSAPEWIAACEAKEIDFPSWIWEWTTTEVKEGQAGFKLLCGPGTTTCGCTHAYDPTWSNEVKGFRCAKPLPNVRLITPSGRP